MPCGSWKRIKKKETRVLLTQLGVGERVCAVQRKRKQGKASRILIYIFWTRRKTRCRRYTPLISFNVYARQRRLYVNKISRKEYFEQPVNHLIRLPKLNSLLLIFRSLQKDLITLARKIISLCSSSLCFNGTSNIYTIFHMHFILSRLFLGMLWFNSISNSEPFLALPALGWFSSFHLQ